jgi:DNA-binding NtrC family response regulator
LNERLYRVAIVDDEPEILDYIEGLLTDAGHFLVNKFTNAKDAFYAISKNPIDAILSDLSMPDMDGLTLFASLKKIMPDLPVVFLTGYPSEEHLTKALQLGACDFIEKPFQPEAIVEVMTAAAKVGRLRTDIVQFLKTGQSNKTHDQLFNDLQTIQDILVLRAFNARKN